MPENDNSSNLRFAQMIANNALMSGNGKPGYIGPIPLNWDASNALAVQQLFAIFSKNFPGMFKNPEEMVGVVAKFLSAIRAAGDAVLTCNSKVQFGGDASSLAGYTANISSPVQTGGMELSV